MFSLTNHLPRVSPFTTRFVHSSNKRNTDFHKVYCSDKLLERIAKIKINSLCWSFAPCRHEYKTTLISGKEASGTLSAMEIKALLDSEVKNLIELGCASTHFEKYADPHLLKYYRGQTDLPNVDELITRLYYEALIKNQLSESKQNSDAVLKALNDLKSLITKE